MADLIDEQGFRANVAIVLANDDQHVFWAGRANRRGWQFPQGGIRVGETPEQAMFRELEEEIGLVAENVQLLGHTDEWLRYRLPRRFQRRHSEPMCVGQKQRWYLLQLCGEADFRFDTSDSPEFDRWCWVDFWYPLRNVIFFKRRVYRRALEQLAPMLFSKQIPRRAGSRRRSPVQRVELFKQV